MRQNDVSILRSFVPPAINNMYRCGVILLGIDGVRLLHVLLLTTASSFCHVVVVPGKVETGIRACAGFCTVATTVCWYVDGCYRIGYGRNGNRCVSGPVRYGTVRLLVANATMDAGISAVAVFVGTWIRVAGSGRVETGIGVCAGSGTVWLFAGCCYCECGDR